MKLPSLSTKVAIPYELKLPCKNVRDEMLKIRTFGSYWIQKNPLAANRWPVSFFAQSLGDDVAITGRRP